MKKKFDPVLATAEGYRWASRIISASLELIIPCFIGLWLDRQFDSSPWFSLGGTGLGLFLGTKSLIRIAKEASQDPGTDDSSISDHPDDTAIDKDKSAER